MNPWVELRDFETTEPSQLAFRALVGLLDTWPDDDQMAAIDHADQFLATWPDATRKAAWSWCLAAAQRNHVEPTWRLCRSLQFESGHLTKKAINPFALAHLDLSHITDLELPSYEEHAIGLLHHRPDLFPNLQSLRAFDTFDGKVRALDDSPLWATLTRFETDAPTGGALQNDPTRIVPKLQSTSPIQHLSMCAADLMALWDSATPAALESITVFVLSVEQAEQLAERPELRQVRSLTVVFRCSHNSRVGRAWVGHSLPAENEAATAFFTAARLDSLEELAVVGRSEGYWSRSGMGVDGLQSLVSSPLLRQLSRLRLELLPLGDEGVASIAPALTPDLRRLELVNVYCKDDGASALAESPGLRNLRTLDLSGNRISAVGMASLAANAPGTLESLDVSGPWKQPYYYDVGQQPMLDVGAIAWISGRASTNLRSLRMANCHLTDDALAAVFTSTDLEHLQELDLSHSRFTSRGVRSTVDSGRWRSLRSVEFNDCGLGDDELGELTRVSLAPKLRSIGLAHNSIGPTGAAALAGWNVLDQVWRLDLFDNAIGDDGMTALAGSRNLARLVELDVAQDCWNQRAFSFADATVDDIELSSSFPRLDAFLAGVVDDYHGAAYSPGFSPYALDRLRASSWMRPAVQASLSDYSGIGEYLEYGGFDGQGEPTDRDFRAAPYEVNNEEGEPFEPDIKLHESLRYEDLPRPTVKPLPETEPPTANQDGFVRGIGFRLPAPVAIHSLVLRLPFVDTVRPLAKQAGPVLCSTVDSILLRTRSGSMQNSGSHSTGSSYSLSLAADSEIALQLLREVLWWLGAPEETRLTTRRDDAAPAPSMQLAVSQRRSATFVQLTQPEVARWDSGYRIDRTAFSAEQRKQIEALFQTGSADPSGWLSVVTEDGGKLRVYVRHLSLDPDFDKLDVLIDSLTPDVSALVFELIRQTSLAVLPMMVTASVDTANSVDCDWPTLRVVDGERFHTLLEDGPYAWWERRGQ